MSRRRLFLDLPTGLRRTVLLAGVARSGTTWAANLIDHRNDHRPIFEPFKAAGGPLAGELPRRPYLRRTVTSPVHYERVRRILAGRFRNPWTDRYTRRALYTRRLVKTVRGNLLLPWIRESFPEVAIVLILRHPCAVAASWLDLGWDPPLAELAESPELAQDHLGAHAATLRDLEDTFLKVVHLWCLEVAVPLRGLRAGEYHLVFYEDLVTDPTAEIERLFAYLGRRPNPSVAERFERPSSVSRAASAVRTGASRTSAWRAAIGERQVELAMSLLESYGLEGLYGPSPLPLAGAAARATALAGARAPECLPDPDSLRASEGS